MARGRFTCHDIDGSNSLKTYISIQPAQLGIFLFRTHREQMYLDSSNAIPAATIEGWSGRQMVSDAAWCGSHLLLVSGFRYLRKNKSYWLELVRQEWSMRSKYGLVIPYYSVKRFDVRGNFRNAAFPRLTSFWKCIEVPCDCYAEHRPVFTYKTEELRDENSGCQPVGAVQLQV